MVTAEILIFFRPVSPVVGMFVPGDEGDREDTNIAGNDKGIRGNTLNHGSVNTEVIFFRGLPGILLKAADDMDFRNNRPGIKEKLPLSLNMINPRRVDRLINHPELWVYFQSAQRSTTFVDDVIINNTLKTLSRRPLKPSETKIKIPSAD